jgi:hypothetical protein
MKFQFKNSIAAMAIVFSLFSCTDKNDEVITGEGNLKLEFDNVYNTNNLAFDTPYTNSNGEVIKINKLKYIVSNIVLTKADGTTYVLPKSQRYFIVDEAIAASALLNLPNIPAGNYTKVSFGIGVDPTQFNLGATGQGDFLALAQTAGMMWSWSAGYKFLAFEGIFTSSTVTSATSFMVHTGQTGTNYNYTTVTLDLPTNALVRTTITPQVHIMADVSKVLDGANKISLTESNAMGMGAMIMSGVKLPLITANLPSMFSIEHVHND